MCACVRYTVLDAFYPKADAVLRKMRGSGRVSRGGGPASAWDVRFRTHIRYMIVFIIFKTAGQKNAILPRSSRTVNFAKTIGGVVHFRVRNRRFRADGKWLRVFCVRNRRFGAIDWRFVIGADFDRAGYSSLCSSRRRRLTLTRCMPMNNDMVVSSIFSPSSSGMLAKKSS